MATAETAVQRQLEAYRDGWKVAGGTAEAMQEAVFVGLGCFAMVEESAASWRRQVVRDARPCEAADEAHHRQEYELWLSVTRALLAAAGSIPAPHASDSVARLAGAAASVERTLAQWSTPEPCIAVGLRNIVPTPEAAEALARLSKESAGRPHRLPNGPRVPEMTAEEFIALQQRSKK